MVAFPKKLFQIVRDSYNLNKFCKMWKQFFK